MTKLTNMAAALAIGMAALNVGRADDVPPVPTPDHAGGEAVTGPAASSGAPIELYACVKVEDEDNIHPCAVPLIVAIVDPCNPCCCRYVQICVPPCECPPEIESNRSGTKVEYDYGEYEIEIKSKDDYVEVNYDD